MVLHSRHEQSPRSSTRRYAFHRSVSSEAGLQPCLGNSILLVVFSQGRALICLFDPEAIRLSDLQWVRSIRLQSQPAVLL